MTTKEEWREEELNLRMRQLEAEVEQYKRLDESVGKALGILEVVFATPVEVYLGIYQEFKVLINLKQLDEVRKLITFWQGRPVPGGKGKV